MDSTFEGKTSTGKNEWLTPPEIIKALGSFDLDPCSPINPPWDIAKKTYTIEDDGLSKEWKGRVFCNPPYGKGIEKWLHRCFLHKDSIVLMFGRTATTYFHNYVFVQAHSIFFIKGCLRFYHVDGSRAKYNAGAPSVLVSYNEANTKVLEAINKSQTIKGKLIKL